MGCGTDVVMPWQGNPCCRRCPNLDTYFSFHFLLLVVAAPVIVMDGDGSSNAVAGPSTLPDVILSYLPPAGKSSHRA